MQGSYKNNGLPRPYYMKPVSKKNSPYDKMPTAFFNSNRRKLLGYLIMLMLFSTCIFFISQELKSGPDPVYELDVPTSDDSEVRANRILAGSDVNSNKKGNIGSIVDSAKNADNEIEKTGLANNLAQGSKGDVGHGVMEAPKGGMANEAAIVGNDEELLVKGKKKGYSVNKQNDDIDNTETENKPVDDDEDFRVKATGDDVLDSEARVV